MKHKERNINSKTRDRIYIRASEGEVEKARLISEHLEFEGISEFITNFLNKSWNRHKKAIEANKG